MGTASFRLLDLDDCDPADVGHDSRRRVRPGTETNMHSFSATAGQRYFFRAFHNNSSAGIRVIDPDGLQISGPLGFSDNEFVASKTGTYTLLLEGRVWEGGANRTYSFAMFDASSTVQAMDLVGAVGGPSLRTGPVGNALAMTAHEEVRLDNPALDLRQDLTVEFWVNPDRAVDSWTPLVFKANAAGETDSSQRGYTVWLTTTG